MLSMMLLIAVSSTLVEMMLVIKNPAIKAFFDDHINVALVFSLSLSAGLGFLFGATGMIMAGAAVLSTMLSFGIYSLKLLDLFFAVINTFKLAFEAVQDALTKVSAFMAVTKRTAQTVRHPIQSRKS
jgi:hypothetical protein